MKNISQLFLTVLVALSFSVTILNADPSQVTASAGNVSMFQNVLIDDAEVSTLQTYLHADKSYECALLQAYFSDRPGIDFDDFRMFSTTIVGPSGGAVSATANGNVFPQIASLANLNNSTSNFTSSHHARLRYSIIASQTGIYKFSTVDALTNNGSSLYALRCRETTLYGAYNRFFAETPIVEIQNKAQTPFPVTITIIDAGGNVVINNQAAVANANTRTDIIFNSLPAGNYGQIIITHTAPFGALSGIVAEYSQGRNGTIILKRERPLEIAQKS